MKKTFIALLAMGGVALHPVVLATEFEEYSSILTGGTTTFETSDPEYSDSSFSLVMNLDVDLLKNQLITTGTDHANATIVQLTLGRTGATTQDIWVSSIYASKGNTKASLWSSTNGTTGRSNLSGEQDLFLSEVAKNDWTGATGAALCITYDKGAGTNTYLTIQMPEANDIVYTKPDASLKYGDTRGLDKIFLDTNIVKQCYTYADVLNQQDALAISKKAMNVPEPTTGTLSLLALAGLCARRRKK